jgi:alanyl-tRNA synthetase
MTSNEIRASFLNYFKDKGHACRASDSLVPDDPTVLFTVAGMVQFKPYFLGTGKKPYTRAATAQKCIRTNDIDNVGFTPRHHTFFEMLGNFSFGDYFKQEAIAWAWDFLVNVCGLDKEKLWVTIYQDDDEAFTIWHEQIGLPKRKIVRMGEDTNFWTMGETGPCGPCSEILYDKGPVPGKQDLGPDEDEDRYLEVWNLVFTQFDRQADGSLQPLPQKNIDTGMGLERLAAVMQHVPSNFDTDLFQPLIQAIAKLATLRYGKDEKQDSSMRVIADHVRSAVFLIADGVLPGNEGRGYVLRRILRRALRHGKLLGLNDLFLYQLVDTVSAVMGDHYPETKQRQDHIMAIIKSEEERFQHTLDAGLAKLNDMLAEVKNEHKQMLPGDRIFQLYDTYGFPLDLTREIAMEHKLALDEDGFEQAMTQQRERARQAWSGSGDRGLATVVREATAKLEPTRFLGYTQLSSEARVQALLSHEQVLMQAEAGQEVVVIIDQSPFYAAAGGQVADQGRVEWPGGMMVVRDVQKGPEGHLLHIGQIEQGRLTHQQTIEAKVINDERASTARNHTATHLLHAALRQVLGTHVEQAGSEVRPESFRFDFTHFQPVSKNEIDLIEQIVNKKIIENIKVDTIECSIEEAKAKGAMALFGEKYGDWVRMVQVNDFSKELCGGTHVGATGDIGLLRVTNETGVAAGIRRIEAVTGEGAYRQIKQEQKILRDISATLKTSETEAAERLEKLLARVKELEKENEKLQIKQTSASLDDLLTRVKEVNGIKCLTAELTGFNANAMRTAVDNLKVKLGTGVIVLGNGDDHKVTLIAAVTSDLAGKQAHAGKIIKEVAQLVGGSGGGRPDFAQAGGKDSTQLKAALAQVEAIVTRQMP